MPRNFPFASSKIQKKSIESEFRNSKHWGALRQLSGSFNMIKLKLASSIFLAFLLVLVLPPFFAEARTRFENRLPEVRLGICERFSNYPTRRLPAFCDDLPPPPSSPSAPVCSDGTDNDNDGLIDVDDGGCHTDFNANNLNSYDPNDNDENSPPVLTLIGDAAVSITVGENFADPGAAAFDGEDGDLTPSIAVGGDAVDPNISGIYVITYAVTDSHGAAALPISRTVSVFAVPPPAPVCSDGLDNDNDGNTDFPDDPGCLDQLDENEIDIPGAGPTLTVALAPDAAPAQQVVMGTTNNDLASFRFTADNRDGFRVTSITITDIIEDGLFGIATFKNLTLWDGSVRLAGPLDLNISGASRGTVTFSLDSFVVPKNSSKILALKGEVATFTSGGAVSGSSHTFTIRSARDITASPLDNAEAVIRLAGRVFGATQTVYRSKLFLSSSLLGVPFNRVRVGVDDVANLNLTAAPANQVILNAITIKIFGPAMADSPDFAVNLIDPNTNSTLGRATQETCLIEDGMCSVTFEPAFLIDAGTTKTAKVRINSSAFRNDPGADWVQIIIENPLDLDWSDDTSNGIGLEEVNTPFIIADLIYGPREPKG